MAESIKFGVDTGSASQDLEKLEQGIDAVGDSAQATQEQLTDLTNAFNAFLKQQAKTAGKQARLFDLRRDIEELRQLEKSLRAVAKHNPSLRGQLNAAGHGGGPLPSLSTLSVGGSAANTQALVNQMLTAAIRHHAQNNTTPINTGLTYAEMTSRARAGREGAGGAIMQTAVQLAQQVSPLFGGAGRVAGAGVEGAAGRGIGALMGGGLGGAALGLGVGALGYGVYKTAAAVNRGVDENKIEATDTDQLRRSMGGMADSFENLKRQSRLLGDEFHLTYAASRKITTDYIQVARSGVGAADQASEGADLSIATGLDPSQGAGFMAGMRHDRSLGDKKADARILAIQFAEALQRTGSVLNASDMMQAISGFSSDTAHRSLAQPNTEAYAGLLSAMVGTKTPGLDVKNSASILSRVDAAYQQGGMNGEFSKAVQFQLLNGNSIGLLGVKARESAGMFATESDVVFGANNPLAKFGGPAWSSKFKGQKTGIATLLDGYLANTPDRETALLSFSNAYGVTPQAAAALYNLHGEKGADGFSKLDGVAKLASGYNSRHESSKIDPLKMSAAGYMTLADIDANGGTMQGLQGIRAGLEKRGDLTPEQKSSLSAAGKLTDQSALRDELVKISSTLEREVNPGEQVARNTADIANAANRAADKVEGGFRLANEFLGDLVTWLAPKSDSAKRIAKEKEFKKLEGDSELLAEKKWKYAVRRGYANKYKGPQRDAKIAAINAAEREELGYMAGGNRTVIKNDPRMQPGFHDSGGISTRGPAANAAPAPAAVGSMTPGVVTPEMREKMLANDAELAKINPQWTAGMTEAQIRTESGFNPSALSGKGARGYAQFIDKTRKEWERRKGRTYTPGNFDDDLELQKLQMSENLRTGASVGDALRIYHGGVDRRNWGKENAAYVPTIEKHLAKQQPIQIPPGNPEAAAAKAQQVALSHTGSVSVNVNVPGMPTQSHQVPVRTAAVAKPSATGAVKGG